MVKDGTQVSGPPIRDAVDTGNQRSNWKDRSPPIYRVVLTIIIALALVNVTSTVLMLGSWVDGRGLTDDVTETLLINASPKEWD